jgi:hypothetical protein
MKHIRNLAISFFILCASTFGQTGLLPRSAEAQARTNSCQIFLHFKLNGIVQEGDIGHMRVRFPASCAPGKIEHQCYFLPISTIDTLGNVWLLDESWPNNNYKGKDFNEWRLVTPNPSIATGEDEVVVPFSCNRLAQPPYGVWVYWEAPWVPE